LLTRTGMARLKRRLANADHSRESFTKGPRSVRKKRNQRGTALVEFALVLPFLAILVFGTIDFGRAYQLQNRLRNAAREGGRLAQITPLQVTSTGTCLDPDNITFAATHEEASASSTYTVAVKRLDTNATLTGCSTSTLPGGTRVLVTVSRPFNVLTPFIGTLVGSPLTLKGSQEVVVQG
jgi:Flp pilus assembly protein TadG